MSWQAGAKWFQIFAAQRWAYDQTDLTKQERAVLLALIIHGDPETWVVRPTQETLHNLTGWSERSVWAALGSLEQRGLISRTPRWRDDGTHRRRPDLTRLHLPAGFASRYRRDPWAAPDDEMVDAHDLWFPQTHPQGVRGDVVPPSIEIEEGVKRSAAGGASRSEPDPGQVRAAVLASLNGDET